MYIYAEVKIGLVSGRKHVYLSPGSYESLFATTHAQMGPQGYAITSKHSKALTERSKDFVLFRAWGFIKG